MRHHRRAEDPEREVEHVRIGDDLRWSAQSRATHAAPIAVARAICTPKQKAMTREERDDERLDPAEADILKIEDQEHVERRDDDADLER